jgi:hypothetical protein
VRIDRKRFAQVRFTARLVARLRVIQRVPEHEPLVRTREYGCRRHPVALRHRAPFRRACEAVAMPRRRQWFSSKTTHRTHPSHPSIFPSHDFLVHRCAHRSIATPRAFEMLE